MDTGSSNREGITAIRTGSRGRGVVEGNGDIGDTKLTGILLSVSIGIIKDSAVDGGELWWNPWHITEIDLITVSQVDFDINLIWGS